MIQLQEHVHMWHVLRIDIESETCQICITQGAFCELSASYKSKSDISNLRTSYILAEYDSNNVFDIERRKKRTDSCTLINALCGTVVDPGIPDHMTVKKYLCY